jgi:hypothetical protein
MVLFIVPDDYSEIDYSIEYSGEQVEQPQSQSHSAVHLLVHVVIDLSKVYKANNYVTIIR